MYRHLSDFAFAPPPWWLSYLFPAGARVHAGSLVVSECCWKVRSRAGMLLEEEDLLVEGRELLVDAEVDGERRWG